jgi:hypothetical protein
MRNVKTMKAKVESNILEAEEYPTVQTYLRIQYILHHQERPTTLAVAMLLVIVPV